MNDCLAACVATVLGLGPDALPDDTHVDTLEDWLGTQGLELALLDVPPLTPDRTPRTPWIAVHKAGPHDNHAVIYESDRLVWDPNGNPARLGALLAGVEIRRATA